MHLFLSKCPTLVYIVRSFTFVVLLSNYTFSWSINIFIIVFEHIYLYSKEIIFSLSINQTIIFSIKLYVQCIYQHASQEKYRSSWSLLIPEESDTWTLLLLDLSPAESNVSAAA